MKHWIHHKQKCKIEVKNLLVYKRSSEKQFITNHRAMWEIPHNRNKNPGISTKKKSKYKLKNIDQKKNQTEMTYTNVLPETQNVTMDEIW